MGQIRAEGEAVTASRRGRLTRVCDMAEEDLHDLGVGNNDPLPRDPATTALALPVLVIALVLVVPVCFPKAVGLLLLRPARSLAVGGRRVHCRLALPSAKGSLTVLSAGSPSVGEDTSLSLLGLLLLDLGDLTYLAQEVGENVLGRRPDVDTIVREVLAASPGRQRKGTPCESKEE